MREIVHVQIGQCGNNIGAKFWEVISDEHGLGPDGTFRGDSELQLQRINVYYAEEPAGRFVPRAVLVDLDPDSLDAMTCCRYDFAFKPENFVRGEAGAANNWAKGYYTEGAELVDRALEPIRLEAETCDLMQGIQMVHAMGGGTGSGVGALLMAKLKEEYPERLVKTYSVLPSSGVSEVVVEPYNSVLGLAKSIENTDQTFCIENGAVYRLCTRELRLASPSLADANRLISCSMAGITSCLRFPGQPNTDLRKLSVNLAPFPRLHFFVPGYAPLTSRSTAPYVALSVAELTQQLFHADNAFIECDPKRSKLFAVAVVLRGKMSAKRVDEQMLNVRNKKSPYFVEWIPDNVQTIIRDVAPRGSSMSGSLISNTSAMQETFERLADTCDDMLKKGAYVHWYTAEGMDEIEFTESVAVVRDLVSEYRLNQDAVAESSFVEESLRYDA